MKLKQRARKPVVVPLFSTTDIAFLMLIFFMLLSLINYRVEVPIDYPEAQTNQKTNAEKNLEVWVDVEGKLYLDGTPGNIRDLELAIIALYQANYETRVHIIADRNTPYYRINAILELLQLLQYRVVSFVVKKCRMKTVCG